MNELKGLTAEAEIRELVTDWGDIVTGNTRSYKYQMVDFDILAEIPGCLKKKKVYKSLETENYYRITYLDPGRSCYDTMGSLNIPGPKIVRVYPRAITTIVFELEKPEVSK